MELDETYADLDRATLLELGRRRDGPGLARFAVQLPWLVASGVWLVLADHPAAIAAALVCHGAAQFTLFGPLHECCHRTAFATRWLNLAGAWIAGVVQLTGPAGMRAFHFAHHRNTHVVATDPELGGMELVARWPTGVVALVNATGLPVLLGRTGWLLFSAVGLWPDAAWRKVLPFVASADRAGMTRDSRILVGLHALVLVAAWWMPELLRLYAGIWLGHALLSLYVSAEHRGLPPSDDVLACTRSFAGNPVVDWLMWNMPYHAEHHGWPGIPFHALPALSRRVSDRIPHRGIRLVGLYLRGGLSSRGTVAGAA